MEGVVHEIASSVPEGGSFDTLQTELTMIWTPSERVGLLKGLVGILHFDNRSSNYVYGC